MSDEEYDWDRAARIKIARMYMGLSIEQLAAELSVDARAYRRWESGVGAIPKGVWDDVEDLIEKFEDLVDSIIDGEQTRYEIPRDGDSMMLRALSIALRERPELEPHYDTPTRETRRVRKVLSR